MFSFLRLLGRQRTLPLTRGGRVRASAKHLFLEALEDRTAPAIVGTPMDFLPTFGNSQPSGPFTANPTTNYEGGPLLQNVQLQSVYFADPTGTQYTDSVTGLALKPQLDAFLTNIAQSNWLTQEINQWSVPAGTYNPANSFNKGATVSPGYTISTGTAAFVGDDTLAAAQAEQTSILDSHIQALLTTEALAGRIGSVKFANLSAITSLAVVWVPAGVEVKQDATHTSVNAFLGYHNVFEDLGSTDVVAYVVLPYQGAAPDGKTGPDGANAAVGAEANSFTTVGANAFTEFQQLTDVSTHEVCEATTDPVVAQGFYGWLDSIDPTGGLQPRGNENGDLANAETSTYHGYAMQELPTRTAADIAGQHGGANAVAAQTGPITTPIDSDFFIDQVDSPTSPNFNGTLATFTDKDGAAEPASNFLVAVNWSDGARSRSNDGTGNLTVVSNNDGTFNVIGKHTYTFGVGTQLGSNAFAFNGLHVIVSDGNGEIAWSKPPVKLTATEPANVTSITSTAANGVYGAGAIISIAVDFNEAVTVAGTPTLALSDGATATYLNGSGSDHLVFTYTVAPGDTTAGGSLDVASSTALAGTIKDPSSNAASLTLPVSLARNSLPGYQNLVIDAIAATVSTVTSTTADGTYGTSATITVTVGFTRAVTVTGTPRLALNSGGTANYTGGGGTSTLTFSYTVAAGQASADLDYTSTGALSLSGGTIKQSSNSNAASLTLPTPAAAGSLGANKNIVIDAVAPTVSNVTATTADGTYGVAAIITITVGWSKAVNVTGTPLLALNSGGTASYSGGSGSSTLTFSYTVAAGQSSADLDCTSTGALTLNGGTIKDTIANNPNTAVLTLPVPGATHSLGANKSIVIDTVSLTVQHYYVLFGAQSYDLIGSTRHDLPWGITGIQVVFNKAVTTGDVHSLIGLLNVGFSGLGTNTLTWQFGALTNGHFSTRLLGSGADAIKDAAGNALMSGNGFAQSFTVLLGDVNGDGRVDTLDRAAFFQPFGSMVGISNYNIFADLNGDRSVNSTDYYLFQKDIG